MSFVRIKSSLVNIENFIRNVIRIKFYSNNDQNSVWHPSRARPFFHCRTEDFRSFQTKLPRYATQRNKLQSVSLSLSLLLVLSVRSLSFEFHWLTRSISASLRRTDQKRGSRRRSANSFGQDCLPKNWNLHEESVYTVQLLKPRSSLSCRIDVFLLWNVILWYFIC